MITPPKRQERLGRIYVADFYAEHHRENIVETLYQIEFFPVRVEHHRDAGAFMMIGFSREFDLIEVGTELPFYELQPKQTDDGKQVISVIRKTKEG